MCFLAAVGVMGVLGAAGEARGQVQPGEEVWGGAGCGMQGPVGPGQPTGSLLPGWARPQHRP